MQSIVIESIFEDYLNKKNTHYALLISGKWGSGKTFLWKNVLSKKVEAKKLKPIYLSLNGIKSSNEIESILISNVIFQRIDNKYLKNVLSLTRNGLNILGNVFAGGSQLEDLGKGVDIKEDMSDYVICFDDLERCCMPVKETLGLINDFTEHKKAKVIICVNEKEFENDTSYNQIKEKIVGRTLKYNANYDEILSSYLSQIDNLEYKEFIENKKTIIIDFFNNHKVENLRTLIFYLDTVFSLFSYYKNENTTLQNNMLFFTAIICNEFKNGYITLANLEKRQGIDSDILFSMKSSNFLDTFKKEKEQKEYKDNFYDKYLSTTSELQLYTFSDAIYEFILTGYLNQDSLQQEISNRNGYYVESEEQKITRKLHQFRLLEEDEFNDTIEELLEDCKNGKYNIYEYNTFFSYLNYFVKNNLIKYSKEEIEELLIDAIEKSKDEVEVNDREMGNIIHFTETENFNKVQSKIFEVHNSKKVFDFKEDSIRLSDIISNEIDSLNNYIDTTLSKNNRLFEFVDFTPFWEKFVQLPNKDIVKFHQALKEKYNIGYLTSRKDELPFFENFKNELENYLQANPQSSIKNLVMKELLEVVKSKKEHMN